VNHLETMTCAEAEPLLPLVADGAIDPDNDPALFSHLAGCPDCQRMVASHDLIALAIARPQATAPRRATVKRFWPLAAAACLVLAAGFWLLAHDRGTTYLQTSVAAKPSASVTPVAVADSRPTVREPEVIAVPRADGTVTYLVRQGDVWMPIDPSALDGPVQSAHGSGSGVQVRY